MILCNVQQHSSTYLAKRAEGSLADFASANSAVAVFGLVLLELFEAFWMMKISVQTRDSTVPIREQTNV